MNMRELTRNQKEELLRERIVSVALKAFLKEGIRAITMDDVASLMGISKRTLYELFPDKEQLVLSCVELHDIRRRAESQPLFNNCDNVVDVLLCFYRFMAEDLYSTSPLFFKDMHRYPSVQKLIRERHNDNCSESVEFLKRGVEQGLFRDDVNLEIAHELLDHQLRLLMQGKISEKYSFLEVFESIFFTSIRGTATAKGQEILENFILSSREKNKKEND